MVNGSFGVKWNDGAITTLLKVTNLFNQSIQQHIFGDILRRTVVGEVRFSLQGASAIKGSRHGRLRELRVPGRPPVRVFCAFDPYRTAITLRARPWSLGALDRRTTGLRRLGAATATPLEHSALSR